MLVIHRSPTLFLLAKAFSVLVAISACHTITADMPLRLQRVILVESLSEAESFGIAIHVELMGVEHSVATVRVCKERDQVPGMVSAALHVDLQEDGDVGPRRSVMSFGQTMLAEDEDSSFDLGGFRVSTSRLGSVSIHIGYALRDSGDAWDGGGGTLRLAFKDILEELKSEDRAFKSSLDEFNCSLPSGIYSIDP